MSTSAPPQFDSPFRLGTDGFPVTVAQDSINEIAACVYNIAVCPLNTKLGDPTFGVPMLLFQTLPIDTSGVQDAIRRLEPRATTEIITTGLGLVQDVQIDVQAVS